MYDSEKHTSLPGKILKYSPIRGGRKLCAISKSMFTLQGAD
jgi:hypothetical protein